MGFVYVWYDRKHKRYYVGSHWGAEDDGYVCSSSWMKRAYKLRPSDFRRRIIARVNSSRQDLLLEENRWLQMIRDDELGKKFYNLTNHLNGHWSTDKNKRMTVGEKISASPLRVERLRMANLGKKFSDEHKKNLSNALKGRIVWNTGLKTGPQSIETNTKRGLKNRLAQKDGGFTKGMHWWNDGNISKLSRECPGEFWSAGMLNSGKRKPFFSEESREQMSINAKQREKIECPHCGKVGPKPQMSRWHFDSCKEKISETYY